MIKEAAILFLYFAFLIIILIVSMAWISGRDGRICTQNLEIPSETIARAGIPALKNSPIFAYNAWQFLIVVVISYCRSEVKVFRFYQELRLFDPKNRSLVAEYLIFCRFLPKMIVDLKSIHCRKSSCFGN